MAKIVGPSIRKAYKKLIKQIIEDLHKPVILYMEPESEKCPNCFWDPINKKSTGTFDSSFVVSVVIFGQTIEPVSFTRGRCPVCVGQGVLISENTISIKALVRWDPDDELQILPVGREGTPIVRLKTFRNQYDNIMAARYFMVDGIKCELLKSPIVRGLGKQEEQVIAYLTSVEVGKDTNK